MGNMDYTPEDMLKESISVESYFSMGYVYFLFYEGILVYVGQTVLLGSRIKAHRKDKAFDRFSYIEVELSDLNSVEANYINNLKPIYNSQVDSKFYKEYSYTWVKDLLLFNGAYSTQRKIFKRFGNELYDVITNSKVGFIHNKCGYIMFNGSMYFCSDGIVEQLPISSIYKVMDFTTQGVITVYKQDFHGLSSITDFMIYAKALNKGQKWAIEQCNQVDIKFTDKERAIAERVVSKMEFNVLDKKDMVNRHRKNYYYKN